MLRTCPMVPAFVVLAFAAAFAGTAVFPDRAAARQATATGRFTASMADQRITVRDNSSGAFVVRPSNLPIVTNTHCVAEVAMTPADNGFDLRLTYTNNGPEPAEVGEVRVGVLPLGEVGWSRNFQYDAKRFTVDTRPSGSVQASDDIYPAVIYSPVAVFGNDLVTVGIALIYPILEYKHRSILSLRTRPGAGGPDWELVLYLDGTVAPGQSRAYTITARFADPGDAWIRTLVPYRDFFQATYGPALYTRDPRPVSGIAIAHVGGTTVSNPWGFAGPHNWRPDLYGWTQFAAFIRESPSRNFARVMLWNPSGVYNQPAVFPFRFATRMNEFPAMTASLNKLRAISLNGLDTGYWWGSCCSVDRGWSPEACELLDITNPDHVTRAFAELDMAVQELGATMIGLDGFGYGMKPWDAHAWMQQMQQRAPGIKFVTEQSLADIYHVLAPTYVYGAHVETPKVLADLLIPGHETWADVRFDALAQRLGRPLTNVDKRAEIVRLMRMGYVPVIFNDYDISGHNFSAQDSWLTTIPEDLRGEAPALPPHGPESGPGPGPTGAPPPPENPESPSVATYAPDRPAGSGGVSGTGASGWGGAGFSREQVLEALRRARP